jgi:type 1 fimbriae regulatory protein FimB
MKDFDDRGGRLTIHRLKGSVSGTFPMHDREVRALRAWIRLRGAAPGPIFLSRNHRALSARRIRGMFERYAKLAGISRDKAHPHTLKHSRGTHLLDETGSIVVVQDALGHRNIQNTLIYSRISNRARDEAVSLNRSKY